MADATATPAPTTTARRRADLQAQPASPPLPNPHTPVAPGPRATRLQELYASSLSHTLARLGWDNFASCYPTMALRAPATLRTVQRQMVDRLGELCNKEFQVILEQRDVVTKLNELEGLVSDAARRRDTSTTATIPPHLLPPSTILSAHLSPHLTTQTAALRAALTETQEANVQLARAVAAQREELEALVRAVEQAAADVEIAGNLLVNPLAADGADDFKHRGGDVEMAEAGEKPGADLAAEIRSVEATLGALS